MKRSFSISSRSEMDDQTKAISATYTVAVHADTDGNMVITKNPTLVPSYRKPSYDPKAQETDGTVDAETMQDATAFLETFFKLYPTATEKELAYYVACSSIIIQSGYHLFLGRLTKCSYYTIL